MSPEQQPTSNSAMDELLAFLPCQTPDTWIAEALKNQKILLINHCYLEQCAARTALGLIFRCSDKPDLLLKMSKLAREELRHFEQVMALLKKRNITYKVLKPSRYPGLLAAGIRKKEPAKLIDTLIIGAFIEARSCERFAKLAPHLDAELSKFYWSLLKSEARHFKDYLSLAEKYAGESIAERIDYFGEIERDAIESPDKLFRFHSGVPA